MVVVYLNIADCDVHRILIDSESSVDILFYNVFSKISIPDGRLGLINSPLVGFTGDAVPVEGIITLTVICWPVPKVIESTSGFSGGKGAVYLQRNAQPTWPQRPPTCGVDLPLEVKIFY